MAGRKIRSDLFSDPTTREDIGLGIRESPFQVRNVAIVSVLLAQVVWVL